jgi:hypothetical protein
LNLLYYSIKIGQKSGEQIKIDVQQKGAELKHQVEQKGK